MGDITDLFSTASRTKVSPQKSFVASHFVSASLADTGATLSVANGQYYGFTCQSTGVSGTYVVNLLENGSIKETVINRAASGSFYMASKIWQNTSGSTQTVKIQASCSSGATMANIGLICGSFIVGTNGSSNFPIQAYIQDFEMCVSQPDDLLPVAVLNVSQTGIQTGTITVTSFNMFVNGINISKNNLVTTSDVLAYVAFDFTGKYLVL